MSYKILYIVKGNPKIRLISSIITHLAKRAEGSLADLSGANSAVAMLGLELLEFLEALCAIDNGNYLREGERKSMRDKTQTRYYGTRLGYTTTLCSTLH